jgi:hypothetical protein
MNSQLLSERLNSLADSGAVPNLHGVVVSQRDVVIGEYYGAGQDFAWRVRAHRAAHWQGHRPITARLRA